MKTTKKERTSVVAAAEYWKRHKKQKDETPAEWRVRFEEQAGAGLENVRLDDLGQEPPRPQASDYPGEPKLPKWSDERGMLDWICRTLDIEDELHGYWQRGREAVMLARDPDGLAAQEFELGRRDRLIATLKSGKASPDLQRYVVELLTPATDKAGKKKPTAHTMKSYLQKLADDFPIWIADRDYPRIRELWRKHYRKESEKAGSVSRRERAMRMALQRWEGPDVSERKLQLLFNRLEDRMKRSKNDPKRF